MNNQGLAYAIIQYFTIDDKPRLDRRNTWFRDHLHMSDATAIRFLLFLFGVALAFIVYNMVGGL